MSTTWKDLPSIIRMGGGGLLSTTWEDLPSIIRIEVGGGVVHHLERLAFHNQDGGGGGSRGGCCPPLGKTCLP